MDPVRDSMDFRSSSRSSISRSAVLSFRGGSTKSNCTSYQLTSALPLDANIYGLGEAVASSGFRRDVSANGTLQTNWARDDADPVDLNM